MDKFSRRHGVPDSVPPREKREVAPEEVRSLLLELFDEFADDHFDPVELVARKTGRVSPELWGDDLRRWVREQVRELDWNHVYDLLEETVDGNYQFDDRINDALIKAGVVYEAVDGTLYPYDPVGEELDVSDAEHIPRNVLKGKFEVVKKQYLDAVASLNGRPPNLEKAVSEAVNALEGTVATISGEKQISKGLAKLFGKGGDRSPLVDAMNQLHNFGSAVPGVRHGAYAPSNLTDPEARAVVRACAVYMTFLMTADQEGTFT